MKPPKGWARVSCPECGGDADAARNGDWRCVEGRQINFAAPVAEGEKQEDRSVFVYTCGARGVTLPDGDLATSQGRVRTVVAREKPRQTKAERRERIRRNREERIAA